MQKDPVVRLMVTGRYSSGDRRYSAGQVIDVPQSEADYLFRDSPGSFQLVEESSGGAIESVTRIMRGGRRRA